MTRSSLARFVSTVAVGVAGILSLGCAADASHHYLHATEQPHAAEWGYEGEIGPEHWGDLCAEYRLAKTGREQSPVDIAAVDDVELPPIEFHYRPAPIALVYNGHTIQEDEAGARSHIEVGGERYDLVQFHFHSPSEHTLRGKHAEMEMHLVHKSAKGTLAVVGVMIEAGAENPAFAPIWSYLPTATNRSRTATTVVDPTALLPADRSDYRYMGSLTTPPCTEGVHWMVLRTPVAMSAAQIAKFRSVIHGNNRPVQPLYRRRVAG